MGLDFESKYEQKLYLQEEGRKRQKELLPIKDKGGLRTVVVDEEDPANDQDGEYSETDYNEAFDTLERMQASGPKVTDDSQKEKGKSFTTANLIAQRRNRQAEYKVKIGVLSASFLEDPENRIKHLDSLLSMLTVKDPAVACTVPKYAALSLLAVFSDVLPAYAIKHHTTPGTKLKSDTKQLMGYESQLLKRYKQYLQRLEKMVSINVRRKRQPITGVSPSMEKVGIVALDCLCRLLASHPYFNLSINIVNFAVPFLNHWNEEIRKVVHGSVKTLFRTDKRGEMSYQVVRRINIIIKTKLKGNASGGLKPDVLEVLLYLRISEADLDKEKKEEIANSKTNTTYAQRRQMSKTQRKKSKDLVKLEKELLEASAEESKTQKSRYLTEISKLVCTIYFRAIKLNPRSGVLSGVLEGLAKFAHIISIEYFEDLVRVLQGLLTDDGIKRHEKLLCIATVLAVLTGQGASFTLDPVFFHRTLFATLNSLSCVSPKLQLGLALRCVRYAAGRNKLPGPRAVAFAKRIATCATQLAHHDAISSLLELKQLIRLHSSVSGLLNTESANANGVYLPEIDDPDHCCAQASTLWELSTLLNHYHPWVRQLSKSIVEPDKIEPLPSAIAQKRPEEVCSQLYPFESFDFIPSPPNRSVPPAKKARLMHSTFKTEYMKTTAAPASQNPDQELDSVDFSV